MSTVEWTEPFAPDETGLDQLGMRVAGETAYTPLVDFTTTVTWRARYLSYLCWSLRKAWREAGGGDSTGEHRIDVGLWQATLRRNDVALAAATILVDPSCTRIAGSTALRRALERTTDHGVLSLDERHLAGTMGSLATYAGVLGSLGLLRVASGIFRTTHTGDRLAEAFGANVCATGVQVDKCLTVPQLARLGAACALSKFAEVSLKDSSVRAERDAIRDVVLRGNAAQHPMRAPTIGLLLRVHQAFEEKPSVDDFRGLLVIGHLGQSDVPRDWSLPPRYDRVRFAWSTYAAHSYVTYALESFLALVLSLVSQRSAGRDDGLPVATLLDELAAASSEDSAGATLATTIAEVQAAIRSGVDEHLEPALYRRLRKFARRDDFHAEWARTAFRLFLLGVVRVQALLELHGDAVWLGDRTPWRLPPGKLVKHLDHALVERSTVAAYARRVIFELVLEQHRGNALRKLVDDRTKYTALFEVERGRLVPRGDHDPGTSNPRFENAVMVLQDLDWLSRGIVTTPTEDGLSLLHEIESGGTE